MDDDIRPRLGEDPFDRGFACYIAAPPSRGLPARALLARCDVNFDTERNEALHEMLAEKATAACNQNSAAIGQRDGTAVCGIHVWDCLASLSPK
jgi:hypothetical protein